MTTWVSQPTPYALTIGYKPTRYYDCSYHLPGPWFTAHLHEVPEYGRACPFEAISCALEAALDELAYRAFLESPPCPPPLTLESITAPPVADAIPMAGSVEPTSSS